MLAGRLGACVWWKPQRGASVDPFFLSGKKETRILVEDQQLCCSCNFQHTLLLFDNITFAHYLPGQSLGEVNLIFCYYFLLPASVWVGHSLVLGQQDKQIKKM